MKCKLVDVFAERKLSGNGLTIFFDFDALTSEQMLSLTQEMRQFESIFVSELKDKNIFRARIFTTEEELDFAGHPLIGLAAHLHEEYGSRNSHTWFVELNKQSIELKTFKTENYFQATMDQGKPEYLKELNKSEAELIISALNLEKEDIADYPLEVISTGLPYLIVPIISGIEKAKIGIGSFEKKLAQHGAKFVYVIDVNKIEGRTWDNLGSIEDIATGSAAGPVGAFLHKYHLIKDNITFEMSQGRFLGRPSKINIFPTVVDDELTNILVSGRVCKIANIEFV